jgi:hypothetical protein
MKQIFFFLLLVFLIQPSFADTISFDLDETLISSDRLTNNHMKAAQRLGYKLEQSSSGQYYILRPGAIKLLEYCKSKDLSLILITSNTRPYAVDILDHSGLFKYFDRVISQEDLRSKANRDYAKYPHHRNLNYPQSSGFYNHTLGLYKTFVLRSCQRLFGNSNIHPFVAATNTAKYPPQYGSRLHIDNSLNHVDRPIDFVGIKVAEFTGLELEAQNPNGDYLWVVELKTTIDQYLSNGWQKLYYTLYNKAPIQ